MELETSFHKMWGMTQLVKNVSIFLYFYLTLAGTLQKHHYALSFSPSRKVQNSLQGMYEYEANCHHITMKKNGKHVEYNTIYIWYFSISNNI